MARSPFVSLDFGQVQVQIQVEPITDEGMRAHLNTETERLRQLVGRGPSMQVPEKAVVIVDGSVTLVAPPTARRLQADWMKDHEDLLQLVTHEVGFVVPNMVLRHTITAVLWLAPTAMQTSTHASLQDAVTWAIGEVDGLKGQVAPELREGGAEAVEKARQQVLDDHRRRMESHRPGRTNWIG